MALHPTHAAVIEHHERTWLVDGKPTTLAQLRATIDAAKARSHAKFAADFGVPCTRENVETAVRTCVANAHAFKPVA